MPPLAGRRLLEPEVVAGGLAVGLSPGLPRKQEGIRVVNGKRASSALAGAPTMTAAPAGLLTAGAVGKASVTAGG